MVAECKPSIVFESKVSWIMKTESDPLRDIRWQCLPTYVSEKSAKYLQILAGTSVYVGRYVRVSNYCRLMMSIHFIEDRISLRHGDGNI